MDALYERAAADPTACGDELLAALAASAAEWKAEHAQIDQELAAAVQKVDGIRAEVDGEGIVFAVPSCFPLNISLRLFIMLFLEIIFFSLAYTPKAIIFAAFMLPML